MPGYLLEQLFRYIFKHSTDTPRSLNGDESDGDD